ncbi:MAG: SUMF1/EgtB/PvdO family nonheme iron enzyme [Spirochaetota bacterium]
MRSTLSLILLSFLLVGLGNCLDTKTITKNGAKSLNSTDAAACENPPPGMVCIPAGKAVLGSTKEEADAAIQQTRQEIRDREDKLQKAKKSSLAADLREEIAFMKRQIAMIRSEVPRQEVFLSTFYIDTYEVTNQEYRKCVAAGACSQYRKIKSKLYSRSLADKQPAVPLSWKMAHQFCTWKGKRLPTEAEWEKVARGGEKAYLYPWGNEKPSCSLANYKYCTDDITKSVGSYPAEQYGVFDMAGNGYEWVNDWASECRGASCSKSCGSDCLGKDPQGPCGGKFPCGKRNSKVLKGGSWWWSSVHMRGASRRLEYYKSGPHRLSTRCAADSPRLTNAPAWMVKNPPAPGADPTPISDKQKKTLHTLVAYDTLNKPLCKRRYQSPAHCKDPVSYVIPNEAYNWLFAKYIKNLRGGYAGVAADANYTFIAHARSEWVWLFDFDVYIVNYHRMMKALILASETPKDLVKRLAPQNRKSTVKVITEYYKNHPDLSIMLYVHKKYQAKLYYHFRSSSKQNSSFGDFGWLRNPKAYRYIRLLHQQNRISISPGDMLKDKTMRSIGKSARELGIAIRVYYPSNAEEFWKYSEVHKKNMVSLPFDEKSVIISTVEPKLHPKYRWHGRGRGRAGFWHYLVRGGLNFQKKLLNSHYTKIDDFLHHRILPNKYRDFSTILLPGSPQQQAQPAVEVSSNTLETQ